ncbi:enhanced intracellular survival protein Eis [Lactococcus nasutitermitis]|uniref:Enhanced intracellular survival protein Eis n=1 Tax=Lactococcus nasutitermitis TaxID=1652957 RepID=A0ABV9JGC7_9LACT|nr:GNAT family N-acetyltransferase [Lactococcus nasutitermitis]
MNTNTKKELLDLTKYAFHKPITGGDEAFYRLLDVAQPYIHRENNLLTSMIIDIPFNIYWKNSTVKMLGIGYVASYPEYRGNGAIRKLMTEILQDNYKKGTAISYLSPFSYDFYRKFGYEYAFDKKIYTVKATDFPKGKRTAGKITRQTLSEAQKDLQEIHEQLDNQGSVKRDNFAWDYYFNYKSQPYFAIYKEDEKALGYLIYDFDGMTFTIKELAFLSQDAKQALYHFINSHAASFDTITWTAPANTQLEYDCPEPARLQIIQHPHMMARIVNLQEFLKINGTPDFAATITDDILPENNITVGNGKAQTMTIGEFTAKIYRENLVILREEF